MIGLGLIVPSVFPHPDNTVDLVDRPQWIYLYHGSGIALAGGGQPTMMRWQGVPGVRVGPTRIGRTW